MRMWINYSMDSSLWTYGSVPCHGPTWCGSKIHYHNILFLAYSSLVAGVFKYIIRVYIKHKYCFCCVLEGAFYFQKLCRLNLGHWFLYTYGTNMRTLWNFSTLHVLLIWLIFGQICKVDIVKSKCTPLNSTEGVPKIPGLAKRSTFGFWPLSCMKLWSSCTRQGSYLFIEDPVYWDIQIGFFIHWLLTY